ncbi:MAG: sensor histidine kinase [Microbacterium ginsengisoli]|uniref:ATP-binding protein n=2 Tax=Microbacteriaceae TaxID=85023 RepID=UPI000B1D29D0|nr:MULTISPECIES: sensor histidine kinase [unclassified Microbacterium]MBN9197837.1 sensor histidine kinase [Microbacterium ginsengisoli]
MRRAMSLRLQLLLLQAAIVCVVTVATGAVAISVQELAIRDAHRERMVGVAQSIARLPSIHDALDSPNPSAKIQPIAEVLRESSQLAYVVVTDAAGIRLSHPNPERIGEKVSTDPSVPLSGEVYVGTQTGTLGESWRVKVPIFDDAQRVIGTVSVGMLESALAADVQIWLPWLLVAVAGSTLVGVFGAAGVTALVRRRIFRLEPQQIAELVDSRETMLHRLSEGVVTVDSDGRVSMANDAAARLLNVDDLVGRPLTEVVDAPILAVLEEGEPDGRLVLAGERALIARGTGTIDDDGRRVGGTLLLRDHTELHAALREMDGTQSLTDGLRAQAHEFSNSLHVISGLLEIGQIDEAREFVAKSRSGGALAVDEPAANLGAELAALLSVKLAQARERGLVMTVDVEGTVPGEASDDLRTVIGNLIDNAFDACRAEDRVAVVVQAVSGEVRVRVDDSGPGLDDEVARRAFDEGFSTKDVAGRRRGIGLALVARVARRRGGGARVSRSPWGGACFEVELRVPMAVTAR